jgi:predicted transcriptional regulator
MRNKGLPMDIRVLATLTQKPKTAVQVSRQCETTCKMVRTSLQRLIESGLVRDTGTYYHYTPEGWDSLRSPNVANEIIALASIIRSEDPIDIVGIQERTSQSLSTTYKSVINLSEMNLVEHKGKIKGKKFFKYNPLGWGIIVGKMPIY